MRHCGCVCGGEGWLHLSCGGGLAEGRASGIARFEKAGAVTAEAGGWGPGAFPPTSQPEALCGNSASGSLSELLCSFSARGVPRATLCTDGARWHVPRYSYDRVAMRHPYFSQISI